MISSPLPVTWRLLQCSPFLDVSSLNQIKIHDDNDDCDDDDNDDNDHNDACDCPQIFIKTLTGRKQAFNFEPENQVLSVKQALQEKEGIQVDQIRLIHSGKQLADDKTLESYNIAAGATIHMVLQLRGGGM